VSKRIKIFSTENDPRNLEAEINQWLVLNEDAKIIKLSTSESGHIQSEFMYTVTILYEEPRKTTQKSEKPKRDHERTDLFDIVDYIVGGNYYRDFVEDMSESGIFIRTNQAFKVGQKILITFTSPNLERPIKLNGQIARTLPEGIGVKFNQESQVQEDMIRSIINSHARG